MRCRKGEKGHFSQVTSAGMAHMHHTRNRQNPEMSESQRNMEGSKIFGTNGFQDLAVIQIHFNIFKDVPFIAHYQDLVKY